MSPRLIRWIGYPLYSLVILFVMVYVTFPSEKVRAMVEDRVSASDNLELSIGSLSVSPLLSLDAENVVLKIRPKAGVPRRVHFGGQGGRGAQPAMPQAVSAPQVAPKKSKVQILSFSRVEVSLGLFALMGKRVDARFEVDGLGGTVKGRFKSSKEDGWELAADIAGLRARRVPQLQSLGPPIRGGLSGKVELKLPRRAGWAAAVGHVDLQCTGCVLGDGKGKLKLPGHPMLKMGVTLPKIRLGHVTIRLPIEKGRLDFDKVGADSPDVKLQLQGAITLRKPLQFSTINAYLQLKLSKEILAREQKLSIIDMALGQGKRPDGFYGVLISGALDKPRVVPNRVGLGQTGVGGRGRSPGGRSSGRSRRIGGGRARTMERPAARRRVRGNAPRLRSPRIGPAGRP